MKKIGFGAFAVVTAVLTKIVQLLPPRISHPLAIIFGRFIFVQFRFLIVLRENIT